MKSVRAILTYVGYPAVLATCLSLYLAFLPLLGPEGAQLPSVILSIVLMAVLERVNPHAPEWRRPRGDVRTDWALNLLGAMIPTALINGLLSAAVVPAAGGLWPSSWPAAAQFVLALLVFDFFAYWLHRALHEVSYLWSFHAVHHGAERLYWLNANRIHPVEVLVVYGPGLGALLLLGCPPAVLGAWAAFAGVHGIAQHVNARIEAGPLNYVFSSPALHRWHHSRERRYADGNYGLVLIFWDIVFRTRRRPHDEQPAADIGIHDAPVYVAASAWRQLVAPFSMPSATAVAVAPPAPGP
jgi:ornithine lipid hydroxylase